MIPSPITAMVTSACTGVPPRVRIRPSQAGARMGAPRSSPVATCWEDRLETFTTRAAGAAVSSGSIDWKSLGASMQTLAPETIGMFEISYDPETAIEIAARFHSAVELLAGREQ